MDKIFHIKSIEDYDLGQKAEIIHKITPEDVDSFARLTGDYNPLHLDANFASKTSFGKPVVFGMLSASFISTLIGMKIPGPGALWTSQTLEFLHQVYIGDEIKIFAVIKQISVATKSLILDIEVYNQNNLKVLQGQATAKILELLERKAEKELKEKGVALVTGGNNGMGAAIAKRLASLGYKVAINYNRSKDQALAVLDEINSKNGQGAIYQADVSSYSQVQEMLKNISNELGPISCFIHCAAPNNDPQKFDELEWSSIRAHFDVQVGGAFNCCKKIISSMIQNNLNGKIIFISSVYADGIPPLYQTDYVIAKAALSAFARSLATEFGPKGIAVNIISPGMTMTDRISHVPEKAKLLAKMQAPSRSLQNVEDISNAVAFLAQQENCSITGETIRICGGSVMI